MQKTTEDKWVDCGVTLPAEPLPIPYHPSFRLMDSSKLACYQTCPRKFFYEYLLGLKSEDESLHLVFGESWHRALEAIYTEGFTTKAIFPAMKAFDSCYAQTYTVEQDAEHKAKNRNRALEALMMYLQQYHIDSLELDTIALETGGLVQIGIEAPDLGHSARYLTYRLDNLSRRKKDNRVVLLEHKTASRGGPSWERQWLLSLQVGTYHLAICSNYLDMAVDKEPIILVNGTVFAPKNTTFLRCNATPSKARMSKWVYQANALWDELETDFFRLAKCDPRDNFMAAFRENTASCSNYSGCEYHDLCVYQRNPLAMTSLPVGMTQKWWNPLENCV